YWQSLFPTSWRRRRRIRKPRGRLGLRLRPVNTKENLKLSIPAIRFHVYLAEALGYARRSMKHVTLRQLRVFLAAARYMNFSRAAEELHLTQPAVSTQIKELAAGAGLPLFERIGRRSYLTPAGAELLQCAKAINQRLRETEDALARL